jgi:hypothetical protein
MSGPMRGGIVGALIYEGLATTWQEAERLVTGGAVRFDPCHHHATVGPMAGATTASMPVLVVENRTAGNRAYSTINEGLGKVLRYGAYAPDVIDRLRWFRDVVGPAFGEAVRRAGGVDLRALIGQAVQMGDECHNRNRRPRRCSSRRSRRRSRRSTCRHRSVAASSRSRRRTSTCSSTSGWLRARPRWTRRTACPARRS